SFLDVYRAFAVGLSMDEVVDAFLEIHTSPKAEALRRTVVAASPDLVVALQLLVTGTLADQAIAGRWLRGEALPAGQFRAVGIQQRIASSEEAGRVMAAIVRLLALASQSQNRPGCRVIWLLDEFQRLGQLPKAVRDEINTGLHSTFNACPTGL